MKRLQSTICFRNFRTQLVVIAICLVTCSSSLKIGETCSNNNCDAGLSCQTCPANGNTRPRCSRIQPASPTSKVKGLPFNRYSWLTTHNSYALAGARSATGSFIIAPMNQEDTVADQLKILIDNKQYYKFLGKDIDMVSLIKLYVEEGKIVRHEDWA